MEANMSDLISIIVPAFNVERYISFCIESLVNQTYTNIEIIIIDDGSKDRSGIVADEYAMRDNRIKVIHKANEGVGSARNTGLDNANGDYVMFVDSDDYIDTNTIENVMFFNRKYNADIVMFRYIIENSASGCPIEHSLFADGFYINSLSDFRQFIYPLFFSNFGFNPIWKSIYKYDIVKNARFRTDLQIGEDLVFNFEAMTNSTSFVYTDKAYYHLVKNQASTTMNFKPEYFDCTIVLQQVSYHYITKWSMDEVSQRRSIANKYSPLYISYIQEIIYRQSFFKAVKTIRRYLNNQYVHEVIKTSDYTQYMGYNLRLFLVKHGLLVVLLVFCRIHKR